MDDFTICYRPKNIHTTEKKKRQQFINKKKQMCNLQRIQDFQRQNAYACIFEKELLYPMIQELTEIPVVNQYKYLGIHF